jgi:nucleoside-diphosphate-sugar epimerase
MKKNEQTVSILGCGWLGLPLGERLKNIGYQVKGSTTSEEKLSLIEDKGIRPFLIQVEPEINADFDPVFFESDMLILNIPPSRQKPDIEDYYPAQVKEVLRLAGKSGLRKILFVSSTSVYPNLNREVQEENAGGKLSDAGKALLKTEKILRSEDRFKVTILRFCGLYDARRNPGRFLAGRKLQSNGQDGVNLIHLDDCINIIQKIMEDDVWNEIFNACGDEHPGKEKFYTMAAQKLGLQPPVFNNKAAPDFKLINSEKLKSRLNYSFIHPDPYQSVKNSRS